MVSLPNISWCGVIVLAGSQFNRHQHSHATSCRHFQVGPQAQISVEFPMPHPGQSQAGMNPHLGPTHQPAAPLHPSLGHIPAPQFQDVQAPTFLPQALHQQYLIQQQILEAQHRRFIPQPRSDTGKSILWHTYFVDVIKYWQKKNPKMTKPHRYWLADIKYWFFQADTPKREQHTILRRSVPPTNTTPPYMFLPLHLCRSSHAILLKEQTGNVKNANL